MNPNVAVLIFLVITCGIAAVLLAIASLLGPKRHDPNKLTTYECGVDPRQGPAADAERIPVKYATIALVFILFDVEAAYFLPWAVIYRQELQVAPIQAVCFIGFFLTMLVGGLIYAYRRHVFKWD